MISEKQAMISRVTPSPAVVALVSFIAAATLARSALASPVAPGGTASTPAPNVGESFVTPGGPAVVTGQMGSMATTTLPGGGQGILLNNGNGTSMLITPSGLPETIATPR